MYMSPSLTLSLSRMSFFWFLWHMLVVCNHYCTSFRFILARSSFCMYYLRVMRECPSNYRNEEQYIIGKQDSVRFHVPVALDSRLLEPDVVRSTLKKIAKRWPFMDIAETARIDPAVLGQRGEEYYPLVTGVCGTDRNIVRLKQPFEATRFIPKVEGKRKVVSFPLGHEIVVRRANGDKGVLYAPIGCKKFEDESLHCDACTSGHQNECTRQMDGPVLGIGIGMGAMTKELVQLPGGFSSESVVAYKHQFIATPNLSDEQAVLVDPMACAINGIMQVRDTISQRKQNICVIGLGAIGFSVLYGLNKLGKIEEWETDIVALIKHEQQGSLVDTLGYTSVDIRDSEYLDTLASLAGGRVEKLGKNHRNVVGGYDVVFDCVGNPQSIHDAYVLTKPGGQMVELGLPEYLKVPSLKQVSIHTPLWASEGDYDLAIKILEGLDCTNIVDTHYTLDTAKEAFFAKNPAVIKQAIRLR